MAVIFHLLPYHICVNYSLATEYRILPFTITCEICEALEFKSLKTQLKWVFANVIRGNLFWFIAWAASANNEAWNCPKRNNGWGLSGPRPYDESTGQRALRNSHGDKAGRNLKRVKSQSNSMAFAPEHSMRFCLAAVKIQFPARLSGCSPGIFSKGHKRKQRTHMHQNRTTVEGWIGKGGESRGRQGGRLW